MVGGGRCRENMAHIRQSIPDSGLGFQIKVSGRGAARAEDAQGTPTQSHISPSVLVYEAKTFRLFPLCSEAGTPNAETRVSEDPTGEAYRLSFFLRDSSLFV